MCKPTDKNKPVAMTDNKDLPADFETAIDATGFGWYNILLLLAALWCAMGTVFESSTVSFILQSAECDLNLTLLDKGSLNAITYAGMISSALFWGFIADTKGRKKILVYTQLVEFICVLGSAMSQNVTTLMIFKYFGGCMASGAFAVIVTYLTEMHSLKYRARVVMTMGIMFTITSLILPALAIAILPNLWNLQFFGLDFHSWQIFLAVCAIPSLMGGCLFLSYPESPKFLMTQGRNKEALEVFQTIFAMNKQKHRNEYPVKELKSEIATAESKAPQDISVINEATLEANKEKTIFDSTQTKSKSMSWGNGLRQMRPLFFKPYLGLFLRVGLLNFCLLMGQNTMRLWLPQLFASITEYETKFEGVSSLCTILEYSVNKTTIESCEVVVNVDSYMNNIIVAVAGFFSYIVAGLLINLVGGKWIMTTALVMAGSAGIALYWSISSITTLIISAVFVTFGSISSTALVGATANLFPTSLRTVVVSLTMMIGRLGSLLGNLLFPIFMSTGCIPPFIMISFVMFFASLLAAFLPNTKKAQLK